MTHPAVEDVAVVGLPHDVDGELPLAFVVLRKNRCVPANELLAYANGKPNRKCHWLCILT